MMFPRFQSRPRAARPEIPELRIRATTAARIPLFTAHGIAKARAGGKSAANSRDASIPSPRRAAFAAASLHHTLTHMADIR
ncbi:MULTISPECIES: hypothetical protein [Burkholderia]|uniref:hypothetical protein n=1 Tax=Burkholderia TaxID=32008 RepID=UPI001644B14A|nr:MULTISPECIES: hypothetical protein [Burkholderia]